MARTHRFYLFDYNGFSRAAFDCRLAKCMALRNILFGNQTFLQTAPEAFQNATQFRAFFITGLVSRFRLFFIRAGYFNRQTSQRWLIVRVLLCYQ